MIWLIAIGSGVVAFLAIGAARSWCRSHGGYGRIAARFATGLPLDGYRRTDATLFHSGTRAFTQTGRASAWSRLPHAYRAGVRWAVVLGPTMTAWGMATHPRLTLAVLVTGGVLVAGWSTYKGVTWWRTRKIRRQVINPMRAALAHRVGQHPKARPDWISVRPGYTTNPDKPVVIDLPPGFDRAAHGEGLEAAALDRLPSVREPIVSWHNYGATPTVTIAARSAPPARVELAELMPAIEAARPDELVFGIGCGDKLVKASTNLDSPHVAVSAPSNSGKSVTVALLVSQKMRRGGKAMILDIKAESHLWAMNLPNAVVLTDAKTIHSGMVVLWDEVARRQKIVERAARAGLDRPEFEEIWVVAEEMNITRKTLKELWDAYREEDKERAKLIPKTSPALNALGNISFAGRSVGVRAILVAQKLTAAATGDSTGAVRENLGIRLMIKPKVRTWEMLADGAALPKFLRGTKGRGHLVIDGEAQEVQIGYGTDAQLRDLAVSGDVSKVPSVWREIEEGRRWEAVGQTDIGGSEAPEGLPEPSDPEPVRPWVTVVQAVADGLLEGNPASLSRALHRDRAKGTAPEGRIGPNGLEYDPDELVAWYGSRPRASRKASGS